jgi:hypothetical protein
LIDKFLCVFASPNLRCLLWFRGGSDICVIRSLRSPTHARCRTFVETLGSIANLHSQTRSIKFDCIRGSNGQISHM